jgi:hypothetical protein
VHSATGTPFAAAQGMDRTLEDEPPGGLAERQRMVRLPVVRPIVGHALPMHLPVLLQDISADGFSAVATINLTPGVAYYLRFAMLPHAVVLRARLAHAARISGDQDPGYVLSFEFVDREWDNAAIATLIAQSTTIAAL